MIKKHVTEQVAIFISVSKWIFLSSVVGVIIGAIVTFFLMLLQKSEVARGYLSFHYYYLLPIALLLTVWIIRTFAPNAKGHGTEKVIEAIHKNDGKINVAVIPVKLLATILTIFAGGSVGKEGPGAQIGAGAASWLSTLLKFSKQDRKRLVICGISAGFATVFGTPIAGAIFGVEVLIIGVIMYDVLLPSFVAGFAAYTTAQFMGIDYTYFNVRFFQNVDLDFPLIVEVLVAGLFFGLVSDFVVTAVRRTEWAIGKIPYHPYIIAFGGGVLIVLMTLVVGDDYLGLGINTIKGALSPDPYFSENIHWYTFILKTLFTSVTLGAGGSGGIITPIFYIGATSGNFFGTIIGDHISLFAALGFVSVLAGTTNTPIAATIMAVELFGLEIAHYAALSVVVSFLITGHRSVFHSQILAMKKSEILSVKIGEEIENANVDLGEREIDRIHRLRERWAKRREQLENKKKK